MREFEMLPYPKGNQSGKLMSDACAVGPLKRTVFCYQKQVHKSLRTNVFVRVQNPTHTPSVP